MAGKTIDFNYKKVEAYVEKIRPPKHVRSEMDIGFKYERNTYEIFNRVPAWSGKEGEYDEDSFVKFRYIKTQEVWKLYWMRGTGKWESYQPFPEAENVDEILDCIEEDEFACFFG